jgi:hypothetical protein
MTLEQERVLHIEDRGLQVLYLSTWDKTDENNGNIQVRIICFPAIFEGHVLVTLLLRTYSLPRERVYRAVVQK